jgi:hypothetical protein
LISGEQFVFISRGNADSASETRLSFESSC